MNVLALQLDGKIPNLAIAKLVAWHRSLGRRVEMRHAGNASAMQPRFGDPAWDVVVGSLIFERTRPLAVAAQHIYPGIELGGTGWDFVDGVQVGRTTLPPDVETMRPDYSGWPKFRQSLGFTQRGCRLECSFCVVPRKEGPVAEVGTLADVWRGEGHPRDVVLLDNDFFGNPSWAARIAEARDGGYRVCWIQGINARLLSPKVAAAVASVRYYDDQFKRPRLYTAWDGRKDERVLFRGLEALKAAGVAPGRVMVYMLIGHEPGETHADHDYRRAKLRAFGAMPYPMPFTRSGALGDELVAFQRWVIQRKDEFVPWSQWWTRAHGNPRKLGTRRVSLPLFGEDV